MDLSTRPTSIQPILTRCQNCRTWQPVVGFTMTECPRRELYGRREWECSMFAMRTPPKPTGPFVMEVCPPEPTTVTPSPEPYTSATVTPVCGYIFQNFSICTNSIYLECSHPSL